MWPSRASTAKYSLLGREEDTLSSPYLFTSVKSSLRQIVLIVSIVLNAVLTLVFLTHGEPFTTTEGHLSSESLPGYDTELYAARSAIKTELRTFTGGFYFNDAGDMIMPPKISGEVRYVGKPSKEIDEAWMALANGTHLALYKKDAKGVMDTTFRTGDGRYAVGLDVFHQLHCLNAVREALDVEYYQPDLKPEDKDLYRMHVDHCLDYVRQALVCHADATPVLSYWSDKIHRETPNFETKHTCRSFEALQEWSVERRRTAN